MTVNEIRQEIAGIEKQRQQAYDTYQQANGALVILRAMLDRMEQGQADGMPLQQLAESVAGAGATATISPNGNGEANASKSKAD